MDLVQELLSIQDKYGELTAANVLKEATKKRHPLHNYFDWNETDAAKKWRLHQANKLIVRAKVTITPHEEKTVHAFVSINEEDMPARFVHVPDAISDDMLAAQIFEQLENRIERIEMQLMAMKQLQGATKDALKQAKKAIAKRAKTLRKTG